MRLACPPASDRSDAAARVAMPVLLAALVLPELVLSGADWGLWGSVRWRPLAYAYGGFWAGLLHGWRPNFPGQPVTMFFTYGFLHAGALHLAGNLVALAWLVRLLAPRFGMARILLTYGLAALAGGVVFGLLSRQLAPMVGASGAVFGLAGLWVLGDALQQRTRGGPWRGVLSQLALAGLLLVALHLLGAWIEGGRLAWQTHLGGFLAGAVLALRWRALPQRPTRAKMRS